MSNESKKKNLFLLTDTFPYGKGEDFIANELDIISTTFNKVYVLPTGIMCDKSIKRELPNNFTLIEPPNTNYIYKNTNPTKVKKIIWYFHYLFFWSLISFFHLDYLNEILFIYKKNKRNSLKKSLFALRNYSVCLRNIHHFKKSINNHMFNENGNIIYSFWFDSSQYMFNQIMKKNKINGLVYKFSRGHRHDIYEEENEYNYLPFRKLYLDNIDDLYLSTKDGYLYMRRKYIKYIDKIKLSYLGTADYKIRYVHKGNVLRIVSCSFISPIKRINLIIDALSMFDENSSIEWIHFGDGILFDEITSYANEKLTKKINFHFNGYTSNKEMMDYYKTNDVHLFINVSSSEGLPVSIQEAISFGIPIIATNVGSTNEAVISDYNGFLLNKNFQITKLYQYIYEILSMEDSEYQILRKNSRTLWEEKFNASKVYTNFFKKISEY